MNRLRLDNPWSFSTPWLRVHLPAVLLAVSSLILFLGLAKSIWLQQTFSWDLPILLALHSIRRPWLDALMWLITESADTAAVVFVLAMAAWFWAGGQRLLAVTMLACFGGAVVVNTLLKLVFVRARPTAFVPLVLETGYSFPSGHVAAAMALYGLLGVLLWRGRHWRWAAVCGLWVVAVGVSRIYLGVHYPSDVLASFAIGLVWLTVVVLGHDWAARRWSPSSTASLS